MRLALAAALFASACVADHHDDQPQPVIQRRACVADVSLDGSSLSSAPTVLGPYNLDRDGITLCLHLDATQNKQYAHLGVATEYATGNTSPFVTSLQDEVFTTLQDSWDVTVDSEVDTEAPRTFANLEWNAPLQVETDAMLWIRARAGAKQTVVSVSFEEPLE
ncbi:MAG TPA: hypothetical protein VGC41_14635 [Kofleriaceae bacterium]